MNDKEIKKCIAVMEHRVPGMSLKATKDLLYRCCGGKAVLDRKTKQYLDKMAGYVVQAYKMGRKDGKTAQPKQTFSTESAGIAGEIIKMAAAAYSAGYCIGKEHRRLNGGETI